MQKRSQMSINKTEFGQSIGLNITQHIYAGNNKIKTTQ